MLRAPHQEGEHSSNPWLRRPGQAQETSQKEHRTRQNLSSSTRTAGARQERARALPSDWMEGERGRGRVGGFVGGVLSVRKGFHASMVERVRENTKTDRKEAKTW